MAAGLSALAPLGLLRADAVWLLLAADAAWVAFFALDGLVALDPRRLRVTREAPLAFSVGRVFQVRYQLFFPFDEIHQVDGRVLGEVLITRKLRQRRTDMLLHDVPTLRKLKM